MSERHPEQEPVVIRDKRRIGTDGTVRAPSGDGAVPDPKDPTERVAQSTAVDQQLVDAQNSLTERTADLQRVSAEYANYRRRVDRDRLAVVETATGAVLSALLPLLDDVDRARAHGDLTGAFKSVGDALERTVTGLGLERFGAAGEPFDPVVHEALASVAGTDVAEPTVADVFQPGYRLVGGSRVLRPARVAVATPGPGAALSTDVEPPADDPTEP